MITKFRKLNSEQAGLLRSSHLAGRFYSQETVTSGFSDWFSTAAQSQPDCSLVLTVTPYCSGLKASAYVCQSVLKKHESPVWNVICRTPWLLFLNLYFPGTQAIGLTKLKEGFPISLPPQFTCSCLTFNTPRKRLIDGTCKG